MLLTIHNLPLWTEYSDIKELINSKCGLRESILDNLQNEGNTMKVTVGVMAEEDAAILVRKINGIYFRGQQLYVQNKRQSKESEQPFRMSGQQQPSQSVMGQGQPGYDFKTLQTMGMYQPNVQPTNYVYTPVPAPQTVQNTFMAYGEQGPVAVAQAMVSQYGGLDYNQQGYIPLVQNPEMVNQYVSNESPGRSRARQDGRWNEGGAGSHNSPQWSDRAPGDNSQLQPDYQRSRGWIDHPDCSEVYEQSQQWQPPPIIGNAHGDFSIGSDMHEHNAPQFPVSRGGSQPGRGGRSETRRHVHPKESRWDNSHGQPETCDEWRDGDISERPYHSREPWHDTRQFVSPPGRFPSSNKFDPKPSKVKPIQTKFEPRQNKVGPRPSKFEPKFDKFAPLPGKVALNTPKKFDSRPTRSVPPQEQFVVRPKKFEQRPNKPIKSEQRPGKSVPPPKKFEQQPNKFMPQPKRIFVAGNQELQRAIKVSRAQSVGLCMANVAKNLNISREILGPSRMKTLLKAIIRERIKQIVVGKYTKAIHVYQRYRKLYPPSDDFKIFSEIQQKVAAAEALKATRASAFASDIPGNWIPKDRKRPETDEEVMYETTEVYRKALNEELNAIGSLIKKKFDKPETLNEAIVYKTVRKLKTIELAKKILGLHITKRIHNTGAKEVRIYGRPREPQRSDLEVFLASFMYRSLKKSIKNKYYLATFDSFETVDMLCSMEDVTIEDGSVTLLFRHVHTLKRKSKYKQKGVRAIRRRYIERLVQPSRVKLLNANWPQQEEAEKKAIAKRRELGDVVFKNSQDHTLTDLIKDNVEMEGEKVELGKEEGETECKNISHEDFKVENNVSESDDEAYEMKSHNSNDWDENGEDWGDDAENVAGETDGIDNKNLGIDEKNESDEENKSEEENKSDEENESIDGRINDEDFGDVDVDLEDLDEDDLEDY